MLIEKYSCDMCRGTFPTDKINTAIRFRNKLYDLCFMCLDKLESDLEDRGRPVIDPQDYAQFIKKVAVPMHPGYSQYPQPLCNPPYTPAIWNGGQTCDPPYTIVCTANCNGAVIPSF
jgi:hypothetical protein